MKRTAWLSAVVLSAGLSTGAFAEITGTAKLDGKAPKRQPVAGIAAVKECAGQHKDPLLDESIVTDDQGNLANVVVFLKGDNVKGEAPKEAATLDQKGCQYVPHVLDVTVGQAVEAKNDDGFLHNVHTLPEANPPSNMAQPTKQTDKLKPITAPELIKVKCDVHPWMSAWIYAFNHPYHSATDDTGAFEIKTDGLKDGTYTIVAWQEKLGESPPQKVTVKGGKADKPITFTFKPKAAMAPQAAPVAGREVALASLVEKKAAGTAEACCEDGKCDEKAAPAKSAVAANK
jgi:plastocyanin